MSKGQEIDNDMGETPPSDEKAREIVSINSFLAKQDEARGDKGARKFYADLNTAAKGVFDKPGALYVAAETLPLGTYNRNSIRAFAQKAELQQFINTFTNPYPIPVVHDHNKETREWNSKASINKKGMVLVAKTRKVERQVQGTATKIDSVFTSQAITEEETIERLMSLTDYTQSVSFMPKRRVCDYCNVDVQNSGHCGHWPGQMASDPETGKETLVTYTTVPGYAIELSFVLVPAFGDAMIKAIEQNSVTPIVRPDNFALLSYNKKSMYSLSNEMEELTSIADVNSVEGALKHDTISRDSSNRSVQEMSDFAKLTELVTGLTAKIDALDNKVTKPEAPDQGNTGKQDPEPKTGTSAPVDSAAGKVEPTPAAAQPEVKPEDSKSSGEAEMVRAMTNMVEKCASILEFSAKILETANAQVKLPEPEAAETDPADNSKSGEGAASENPPAGTPVDSSAVAGKTDDSKTPEVKAPKVSVRF